MLRSRPLVGLWVPYLVHLRVPKWPQNNTHKKQQKKPVFWLFWTIFAKRMGLLIWLGAYFLA
jgi:hypothetical protein